MNKKSRQVPFFLYWPVENVKFCVNFIVHFGWLSGISNFPRFQKNVSSLENLKYISENSSPKGSFWRNKRKSEFSELSLDSPYVLSMALKRLLSEYTVPLKLRNTFSRVLSKFNYFRIYDSHRNYDTYKIYRLLHTSTRRIFESFTNVLDLLLLRKHEISPGS